eukprot:6212374-Pleurochrysis_carterae.AAC.1
MCNAVPGSPKPFALRNKSVAASGREGGSERERRKEMKEGVVCESKTRLLRYPHDQEDPRVAAMRDFAVWLCARAPRCAALRADSAPCGPGP